MYLGSLFVCQLVKSPVSELLSDVLSCSGELKKGKFVRKVKVMIHRFLPCWHLLTFISASLISILEAAFKDFLP